MMRAMRNKGINSAAELHRLTGITQSTIGLYLNLRQAPTKRNGEFTQCIMKIADYLSVLPEMLFPEAHIRKVLEKNTGEFEVTVEQMAELVNTRSPETLMIEEGLGEVLDYVHRYYFLVGQFPVLFPKCRHASPFYVWVVSKVVRFVKIAFVCWAIERNLAFVLAPIYPAPHLAYRAPDFRGPHIVQGPPYKFDVCKVHFFPFKQDLHSTFFHQWDVLLSSLKKYRPHSVCTITTGVLFHSWTVLTHLCFNSPPAFGLSSQPGLQFH